MSVPVFALGDRVEYAPHYFPNSDLDLFAFIGPHQPPRPHLLSETGYWSIFTSHDAVEACGGPEAYAALLVEALLRGDQNWDALFDGVRGEQLKPRRKRGSAAPAALPQRPAPAGDAETRQASGPHSTRILAEEADQEGVTPAQARPKQGFLF